MATYYMYIFQKHLAPGTTLKYHYAAILSILSVTLMICLSMQTEAANTAVGYMGVGIVIIMFSSPLVVISNVIKTRNTASLPPLFTFASFLNCVLCKPPPLTHKFQTTLPCWPPSHCLLCVHTCPLPLPSALLSLPSRTRLSLSFRTPLPMCLPRPPHPPQQGSPTGTSSSTTRSFTVQTVLA